jgi:hypothetical protein
VLGPTHEEVITPLVKSEISSYRDLPKTFFQIATKFRNEIRPRFGLMRAREFVMMDAYSFDADDAGAIRSYMAMKAPTSVLPPDRAQAISVEADTGVMGGSFLARVHGAGRGGRRRPVLQRGERLRGEPGEGEERPRAGRISPTRPRRARSRSFPTPGVVTIAALEAPPYGVPADRQFKTLVYIGDGRPFAVILRGCDELEEAKLGALGFTLRRPATPEEIEPVMGARPGSLGRSRARSEPARSPGSSPTTRSACRQRHDRREPGRLPPAQRQRRPRPRDHALRRLPAGAGGGAGPAARPAAQGPPRRSRSATSSSSGPSTPRSSTRATPTTRSKAT